MNTICLYNIYYDTVPLNITVAPKMSVLQTNVLMSVIVRQVAELFMIYTISFALGLTIG